MMPDAMWSQRSSRWTQISLQCIYGDEESDMLCPELRARGVEVLACPGGHHLDHYPVVLAGLLMRRP